MMGLPTCREVAAQLSREQDTAVPMRRSRLLSLHLMMCRYCRRYDRQLAWLRRSLKRARVDAAAPKLSACARARIHQSLQDDDSKHPPV